jgi:uncharacterized protein
LKNKYHKIILAQQEIYLLPQKAIFFSATKQLVLSDVHLGKTTHFRKQGLAIPLEAQFEDLHILEKLIEAWKPISVIILGDLFHSDFNMEWHNFEHFLAKFRHVQFVLVKGNHDIINFNENAFLNFSTTMLLEDKNFTYQHFSVEAGEKINFCGHLHPAVQIKLKGKQYYRFPCFLIDNNNFTLPAFGKLTGSFIIKKNNTNAIYAIGGDTVFEVK